MTLQLFYSKKCPKSREILSEILNSGLRSQFILVSIDKHLETKRRMPKGVRVTPTVHRETSSQIHVYEGDDIRGIIKQMNSSGAPPGQSGPQGAPGQYNNDFISNQQGPQEPQAPVTSAVMSPPSKNKYQQESKSTVIEDESWKNAQQNADAFKIPDSGESAKVDPKSIETQRAEMDKRIEQQLESQKNDPKLQQWMQGVEI